MKINCKKETERIVKFIKDTFAKANKEKAIIGISGGLDSAVVASLLTRALGTENVYGYILPYHFQHGCSDAGDVSRSLRIAWQVINIGDIVDMTIKYADLQPTEKKYLSRVGNIKARTRMIMLYDLSAKHNALVVGTGNKTELLLGYFTLYGDGACALEPIGHLYKTQVKQLAKYLKISDKIINKAPSAGLWEGQTDEKELGMSYKEIDEWLSLSETYEIVEGQGVWTMKTWLKIKAIMDKNSFKLKQPKELK